MTTVKEQWFRRSYELQMSLIDRVLCTKEELMEVQRMMQPCQLEDVSFERASAGMCGHVGCGLAARPIGGKKWLVDRKSAKVWDQQELNRFCSKACYASYMKLKATLQDEPAWNEATRPNIGPVRQPRVKPVAPEAPQSSPVAPHPQPAIFDVDVNGTRPHDDIPSSLPNLSSTTSTAVAGPTAPAPPIRQPAVVKLHFTQPSAADTKTIESPVSRTLDLSSISQKEEAPRSPPVAPPQFPGFILNTEACPVRASSSTAVPSVTVTAPRSADARSTAVADESRRASKIPRLSDAVAEKVHDVVGTMDSCGARAAGDDDVKDEDEGEDDDWDMFDMRDTFDCDDPDDKQADLSRRQEHLTNSSFFLYAWQFLSSAVQDKTYCLLRGEPYVKTEISCDRRDLLLDRWYPWIREYNGDATDVAEFVSTFQIWQALPGATAEETLLLRFMLLLCLEQLNPADIVKQQIEEIAKEKRVTADNLAALRDIFVR